MTPTHDLFVGALAVLVGSLLAVGAMLNYARLMSLAKPRRLEEAIGNGWARAIIGVIGLVVIGMGVLIASGWRVRW